jgi:glycosyltransferase involved in cell wall biosynthesis
MKILILNWRDIKNPAGGGAEILTHELAKGWVKAGNQVLVLSSKFLGAKENETLDGVRFVRRGRWWTVHVHALFYYLKNRKKFDIVIDEVHWFPFFAGVYARKKTIALTCEVANKLFFKLFPKPIALFFRLIEKIYLFIYKNVPTMAISESTKKDLIKEGINPKSITVLQMGLSIPKKLKKYPKEKNPTFIYLARLNKQKGIFDAIETIASIKNQESSIKAANLWVVGSGEEDVVREVKEKVEKYKLESSVKFFGFVTETKKFELLARAHILLIPSIHEGWGLTAVEAASQGTPVVGYDIPGLRDSVENGKTGILVNPNPKALSETAIRLIKSKLDYEQLQKFTLTQSKQFDWSRTIKISLKIIHSI